jgi:hypothetical protein
MPIAGSTSSTPNARYICHWSIVSLISELRNIHTIMHSSSICLLRASARQERTTGQE